MQNYNLQQQAIILKGIAQQLLSMNMPSFSEVNKLFSAFGMILIDYIDFEYPLEATINDQTFPARMHSSDKSTVVYFDKSTNREISISYGSVQKLR